MITPDINEFKALSARGNLIPVYREIFADLDTPVSAYLKLGEYPSFLLESIEGGEKWARYSFLGSGASKLIYSKGNRITIVENSVETTQTVEDPIGFLRDMMSCYKPVMIDGLPVFFGGLVGYMSYDMVRFMESLPDKGAPSIDAPDMFYMLTDTMLVFDNLKQTIKVISCVHLDGRPAEEVYSDALAKIQTIVDRLRKPIIKQSAEPAPETSSAFVSSFGQRQEFEQAVQKAKEYVNAGDIVQVVLSQRFERRYSGDPFDIYRALRVVNPSPYMYYLNTGDMKIAGSSPEILVRLEGDAITVRPIAGTRRRGASADEDASLEEELRHDPKEIAEHIMLVDLGRNDVGRVAETGSVMVTELMGIERYSHVMHMVSNVEGRLKEGLDCFDVLKACFPAGTVTGAPKIRAMEIIDELEPVKRGAYAGTVGYFGYSGDMDTCITIRTLISKGPMVYVQAGAGIVADSDPGNEYMETVHKAKGMIKAVEMAEKIL